MIKLDKVIIVEGIYDKIRLSSFIDALIIPTNGFRIFKDKSKLQMIKNLSKDKGVIIVTDSDSAGFVIRNHLKGVIDNSLITNVYTPEIFGKEKRKTNFSKEGKLGVEGLSKEILLQAFMDSGVDIKNSSRLDKISKSDQVTNNDLYFDGLIGQSGSKNLRKKLLQRLNLPEYISTKALLDIINRSIGKEKYKKLLSEIR